LKIYNLSIMKYVLLVALAQVFAAEAFAAEDRFQALEAATLDPPAFTQSVGGRTSPLSDADAKGGPTSVVWTTTTRPDFRGAKFGDGRAEGPRHLRIGFTEPLAIGSVLVRSGGTLSVLKPNANYPGDLADESAWSPAERLVDGDQRLLITRVKNQTRALLYRAKVPGTKEPVQFGSPWRSVPIDIVEDVSGDVTLADDGAGNFEIGVSLEKLRWTPKWTAIYRGDLGILRGSGGQTTQRVYWSNKATAITADVPSEAELTPRLWGKWKVFRTFY